MLEGRDRDIAAAAACLRSFQADPARMGALLRHGVEPLPDGAILLRLAQGKIASSFPPDEADRLSEAARAFVRGVCLWEGADHYQVLCARRDATPEAIKENYHLLMALLHPDRQEAAAHAWPQTGAQRVNLAYATLGEELSRREYDAMTRTGRAHSTPGTVARAGRRVTRDVRFAKAMIVVSAIVAALVTVGLLVDDDEWGDRSVLEASFARLRTSPAVAADRPRYVGASAVAVRARDSDAVVADEPPFSFFQPLMRVLAPVEPTPMVPAPQVQPPPSAAPVAEVATPPAQQAPVRVAQATPGPAPAAATAPLPATTPVPPAPAPAPPAVRPNSQDMENVVISLISYYEAGDTDGLIGLMDAGFWRNEQARTAYGDFFRATRTRRLRLERLAWNASNGSARAKGEAVVLAEYFEGAPAVEKHVNVEMDVVVRNGKPRISRLSLFPDSP